MEKIEEVKAPKVTRWTLAAILVGIVSWYGIIWLLGHVPLKGVIVEFLLPRL